MLLRLYCNSRYIPDEDVEGRRRTTMQEYNKGFHLVMYLLWLLERRGIKSEIIDTAIMFPDERKEVYESIIPLSVQKKHGIRRVFGTKHESGTRFGIEVPALLVYEDDMTLNDIYPRKPYELKEYIDYPVQIVQCLVDLLSKVDGLPTKQIGRLTKRIIEKRRTER